MTLFGSRIYGGIGQLGASAKVTVPWWLSGGISAANCIAAYQPKGAADLAASYINLATPGTYNAAPGVAPTWDAVSGWIGNGTKWLETGIYATARVWSMVVRFSNSTAYAKSIGGSLIDPKRFFIRQDSGSGGHLYWIGNEAINGAGIITGGVMAICGRSGYLNGAYEGIVPLTTPAASDYPITIFGAGSGVGNTPNYISVAKIQAFAVYDINIAAYVGAVSTAMAAL